MTDSKWHSRKLWTIVVFQIVFTVLLWNAKLSESVYENLSIMLLGGYLISNVSQKALLKDATKS